MRMILELIGDLALNCRSSRARSLLWGSLFSLLISSVALVKAPILLWDQRWFAGSLALAVTLMGIIFAASMITAGIRAELQASARSEPAHSATRWLFVVLLTLLVIPPPICLVGLALILLRERRRRAGG